MRKFLFLASVITFLVKLSTAQISDHNLGIIPAPLSVTTTKGEFIISRESGILYETVEDYAIAKLFHEFLKNNYYLDIPIATSFVKAPAGIIRFTAGNYFNANKEGYNLSVTPLNINVSGKSSGLFYGLQSLLQLFPTTKAGTVRIQCAEIVDEPRYKYRGLHLDVARHIYPVTFIKKYIDLIAQYKLNTFHWHLTDDQGWRIEIKKYPKLTKVGGYRNQTLIGNYHDRFPQWYDGTQYGGFYSQKDIKEIVAYATARFVNVIPEIEMPGHSLAALAAYPELGCHDNPAQFKVAEKWGVFDDVFCAGKENTFIFLEDVLTEVMELFPSQYIHIGGDESPKSRWKLCKFCQKRIKDNNLRDEDHLQSYFIHRIEKFVNSNGRKIIGWDEILEGGLAPNATVMSWRGTSGGIMAARQNHDVIMTPNNYLYFDQVQGRSDQEPVSIGGYNPLEEVYSYNPTPVSLTSEQQSHIIGVQANIWTEYVKTSEKVEYMILPRLFALSEIAWSQTDRKDYINFSQQRVAMHLAKLDQTNTAFRVPTAYGVKDTTLMGDFFTIPIKTSVTGAKVYYTLDGYKPTEIDLLYEKPIQISVPDDDRRILKTVVITPSGKRSAITTTHFINSRLLPSVPTNVVQPQLKYYYIPGNYTQTGELNTSKATEEGYLNSFNIGGFKEKARAFGLIFEGYINATTNGTYTFSTSSDDGSQLYIDDILVVDNDHKHAAFELTSAINLVRGFHKIQIRYFQAGGYGDLKVFMAEPGNNKHEISPGLLFH